MIRVCGACKGEGLIEYHIRPAGRFWVMACWRFGRLCRTCGGRGVTGLDDAAKELAEASQQRGEWMSQAIVSMTEAADCRFELHDLAVALEEITALWRSAEAGWDANVGAFADAADGEERALRELHDLAERATELARDLGESLVNNAALKISRNALSKAAAANLRRADAAEHVIIEAGVDHDDLDACGCDGCEMVRTGLIDAGYLSERDDQG